MYSAPIICNNHVVGFFANDLLSAKKVFSISDSSQDLLNAIEAMETEEWDDRLDAKYEN